MRGIQVPHIVGSAAYYARVDQSLGVIFLKLVTLHVPDAYLKGLDRLVEEGFYPNRSELIRTAVRDLLRREAWAQEKEGPLRVLHVAEYEPSKETP